MTLKNYKCETKIISKNYDEKNILKKIQNSDALIHLSWNRKTICEY